MWNDRESWPVTVRHSENESTRSPSKPSVVLMAKRSLTTLKSLRNPRASSRLRGSIRMLPRSGFGWNSVLRRSTFPVLPVARLGGRTHSEIGGRFALGQVEDSGARQLAIWIA